MSEPLVEQAVLPANFGELTANIQFDLLLTQAEATARQIKDPALRVDALIAVAEQSPSDAQIWDEVLTIAKENDGEDAIAQRVRAFAALARSSQDEDMASLYRRQAFRLGTAPGILGGEESPPIVRIFDDLITGQTDPDFLRQLVSKAEHIGHPSHRSTAILNIAKQLVSLGYHEAQELVPGETLDRHELAATRARAYTAAGYSGPAYLLVSSLDEAGKARVYMAIAGAQGSESDAWGLVEARLQKPEVFHPSDALAMVEGLLADDRHDSALELARTIRIEEGTGRNYRAEAFMAIAQHLGTRPEGEDDARAVLDHIQEDTEAVHNLALRKQDTVFGENQSENIARVQNCRLTLDEIAITRLRMQAEHNPNAAWDAVATTEFATDISNGRSPLESAQAEVIRTIAQQNPTQAVLLVEAVRNPAVQSELYIEFAVNLRQNRRLRVARHLSPLDNQVAG